MIPEMQPWIGKALTVTGPRSPSDLGTVMMHEHLHSDAWDAATGTVLWEEHPPTDERRAFLLANAVPALQAARQHGLVSYVDCTMPGWRTWPTFYREVAERSGVHIVMSTGFYREMEVGRYWVKTADDAIWPYVRRASVEELADYCIREIAEGVHGTGVRAGVIKLGTSQAPMTGLEIKTFRAGARAQKATGVHITTHCTALGAETSQLTILDSEGVDLSRVAIGHTAGHLMNPGYRHSILEWMKRGACFLPTNLAARDQSPAEVERWRPLIEAIHEVFQAGLGGKLFLGLDHGYASERGVFRAVEYMPPPPWLHLFTHVLPVFRAAGLTAEEEEALLRANPQRMIPVQAT